MAIAETFGPKNPMKFFSNKLHFRLVIGLNLNIVYFIKHWIDFLNEKTTLLLILSIVLPHRTHSFNDKYDEKSNMTAFVDVKQ